jgi:hypothetical protein
MLVPGQTAEGSWPLVKVTNFGLPAMIARPEPQRIESNVPDKAAGEQGVTDQQFSLPTTDIGSEIYSLGVTLYFLLSGVALSAETLQHGPKFSGFPKPLRALLGRLLHRDPDRRPKDLLVGSLWDSFEDERSPAATSATATDAANRGGSWHLVAASSGNCPLAFPVLNPPTDS